MKLAAGAAVVLAIGAGVGTYFLLESSPHRRPPVGERYPVLERAISRGVITGYRLARHYPAYDARWDEGDRQYVISGSGIHLRVWGPLCGGDNAGPACLRSAPLVVFEYRRPAAEQAQAIAQIARARMPNAKIQTFEITTLGG